MTKMTKIIAIAGFLLLMSLGAQEVLAARLFLESPKANIGLNQKFELTLFIDTEGAYINALQGEIIFPPDLLNLSAIADGKSLVNFWVEKPDVPDSCDKQCIVKFGGIVPGGYLDKKGEVLSLIFLAKAEGAASIQLQNLQVLANDGQGTAVPVTAANFNVDVGAVADTAPTSAPQDKILPEPFFPQLAKNAEIFGGQWFLAFAAQDKDNGIDHYEAVESKSAVPEDRTNALSWQRVESPYVIKDQSLKSFVYIKALDRQGNGRIAVVSPEAGSRPGGLEKWPILGIIFVVVLWLILKISNFFKKKQNDS